MPDHLDHTMWGLQQQFRESLDGAAARALEQIGAALAPRAHVAGFLGNGHDADQVCLESGSGRGERFTEEDFATVVPEAKRRYHEDAVHEAGFPSEELADGGHLRALELARAAALEAAMAQAPAGRGRTFFVGDPATVGEYDVHPVVSVDTEALDALPRLETTEVAGSSLTVSLAHGVVGELLRTATHALQAANPPATISPIEDDVPNDAIRRAANHLVFSAGLATGQVDGKGLFESLEAVASTAYEGRAGAGTVILAADGHPHVDVAIRLRSPIRVDERLPFRKLLELTDQQLGLLTDGRTIYGLGAISEEYDGRRENLFRFAVLEHGVWTLAHHGAPLLRVANGRPLLPRPRMSPSLFVDSMRRVFVDVDDHDIRSIWRLTQTAVAQGKGTMLVVTTAAAEEASRLAPQTIAIEPQPIGSRMLRALTKIDGAVLLTPDGTCHAVGAILDGLATGAGDPGRGARYNSAVRYVAGATAPCLIVIVSDDGMIDVHPDLGASPSGRHVAGG